eukprot:1251727-Prymnesium_polylepis.1
MAGSDTSVYDMRIVQLYRPGGSRRRSSLQRRRCVCIKHDLPAAPSVRRARPESGCNIYFCTLAGVDVVKSEIGLVVPPRGAAAWRPRSDRFGASCTQ